jgi:hypothetical protein
MMSLYMMGCRKISLSSIAGCDKTHLYDMVDMMSGRYRNLLAQIHNRPVLLLAHFVLEPSRERLKLRLGLGRDEMALLDLREGHVPVLVRLVKDERVGNGDDVVLDVPDHTVPVRLDLDLLHLVRVRCGVRDRFR